MILAHEHKHGHVKVVKHQMDKNVNNNKISFFYLFKKFLQ